MATLGVKVNRPGQSGPKSNSRLNSSNIQGVLQTPPPSPIPSPNKNIAYEEKQTLDNFLNNVKNNIDKSFMNTIINRKKPKVLFICDVRNWAWYFKSEQLKKYLSNDFDIDIACVLSGDKVDPYKYDIYFTFGYSYIDIEALKNVPKSKKITGITAHRPKELIEPKMNMASAVHANSYLLLKELKKIHDKVYYLPNGVDENLFNTLKPIPSERENIIVGHVGKWSPLKGQLDFIEPAVKKAKCLYHCNYKDYVEAQPHHIMPNFYNGIDVFIVASTEDGTPNPALEAAACGRPIISNKVGNMPQFIDNGVNGFLIEKDVNVYAEKILWLRDHRSELQKMGKEARKTVLKRWTWKIQAENYRKMLWDVVNIERSKDEGEVESLKHRILQSVQELENLERMESDIYEKRKEIQRRTNDLKKDIEDVEKRCGVSISLGIKDSGDIEKINIPVKHPKPIVEDKVLKEGKTIKREVPSPEPIERPSTPEPKNIKPNILMLSDVSGWAWETKSKNIKKWLSDEFNIHIRYFQSSPTDRFDATEKFDLYFCFDCGSVHFFDHIPPDIKITGVTSHTYTNYRSDYRLMLKKAKWIHANSVLLQKELEKNYGGEVFYLPNGVDEELFNYKEKDINKPFVVGYVGKNTERKGYVGFIVEGCRQAVVELKSQVCRFNSPNVIKPDEMPPFYNEVDCVMIASDMDGTPNQLLEAAATGRTFLGNKIGNVPEFVDNGVNGFMVERRLSQYIERLNWMKENRDVVKEMGIQARKTIEEGWTWKIQAENYRNLFRKALGISE